MTKLKLGPITADKPVKVTVGCLRREARSALYRRPGTENCTSAFICRCDSAVVVQSQSTANQLFVSQKPVVISLLSGNS